MDDGAGMLDGEQDEEDRGEKIEMGRVGMGCRRARLGGLEFGSWLGRR